MKEWGDENPLSGGLNIKKNEAICQAGLPDSSRFNCDEFVKSQEPEKMFMLNFIQHPCLRQAGKRIKELRDSEATLKQY